MKTKSIIIGIIFCACLALGYLVAAKSGNLDSSAESKTNAIPKTIFNIAPRQSNNLILLVDDLTAEKPQLTTIWMVFFYPKSQPYLIQLPVYPTTNKKINAALQKEFIVTPLSGVNQSFWDKLETDFQLTWDHYLIVDETSLATLTQQLIGEEPPARLLKPANKRKITNVLADTTGIMKKICGNLVSEKVNPAMMIEWKDLDAHLLTDMHTSNMEKDWNWILSNPLVDPCNIISYK